MGNKQFLATKLHSFLMIDNNKNQNNIQTSVDTTQTSDVNYNKNFSSIFLNKSIEQLHDDDKSLIISGQTLTFATHNIQGLRDSLKSK